MHVIFIITLIMINQLGVHKAVLSAEEVKNAELCEVRAEQYNEDSQLIMKFDGSILVKTAKCVVRL